MTGFGAESVLQIFKKRLGEAGKVRRAVVLQRNIHRLTDFEWHVGRAGHGQCFVSDHDVLRLSPLPI